MKNYSNERSIYLAQLRDSIEAPWQAWELSQIDVEALKALSTDEVRTTNAIYVAPGDCVVTRWKSALFAGCLVPAFVHMHCTCGGSPG